MADHEFVPTEEHMVLARAIRLLDDLAEDQADTHDRSLLEVAIQALTRQLELLTGSTSAARSALRRAALEEEG